MRICILGAGGIIGRAICDICEEQSIDVVGVVKGSNKPSNKNIIDWKFNSVDIQNVIKEGTKWDAVFDLRAFNPRDITIKKNIVNENVSHWFHISTIYVYKNLKAAYIDSINYEFKEDDDCNPSGEYGINKLFCEKEWISTFKREKTPITIVRLPFIYGPYDRSGRIQTYLNSILNYNTISLPNFGENLIDLLYSMDLARILITLIGNKSTFGKILNIANFHQNKLVDHLY
ncbi:MAG: NAD-dependent epimerase/dehydratase family protein, partial [Bacteroidetes bacterium]|nr:NAD-dependent epimerase/dehydratase family protein [Bacteroidota bacterium]